MKLEKFDIDNQRQALQKLAELTEKSVGEPLVRQVALQIIRSCSSRDDHCELEAIFNAVKYGDPAIKALKKGFKYVADPVIMDYFVAPRASLESCEVGACGGDCDDHASLISALAATLGFTVGLRAWGSGKRGEDYVHVYAVVALPKRPPFTKEVGLDTTVDDSNVGWEPRGGMTLTAWLE